MAIDYFVFRDKYFFLAYVGARSNSDRRSRIEKRLRHEETTLANAQNRLFAVAKNDHLRFAGLFFDSDAARAGAFQAGCGDMGAYGARARPGEITLARRFWRDNLFWQQWVKYSLKHARFSKSYRERMEAELKGWQNRKAANLNGNVNGDLGQSKWQGATPTPSRNADGVWVGGVHRLGSQGQGQLWLMDDYYDGGGAVNF